MPLQNQDDYLDLGYFRSGHTIRQTRFVFLEQDFWSTVWSRVPLQTYTLKKRQRKLWRRTLKRFTVEFSAYQPSEDQDAVYHAYQKAHPLDVARNMAEVLGNHQPTHNFQTQIAKIYDGDRLAGFSCFDLGQDSIASIFGCYHPDYSRDSLGTFSMLAELAYGRELKFAYYHPGYCVPGVPAFDYKLNLPDLQGKSYVDKGWSPMPEVLEKPLPHTLIKYKLQEASNAFKGASIAHCIRTMPLCELMGEVAQGYGPMPQPLMIELTATNPLGEVFVGYDVVDQQYEIWFGQMVGDLRYEPDFEQLAAETHPDANLKFYEWRARISEATTLAKLLPLAKPKQVVKSTLLNMPIWALANAKNDE